MGEVLFQSILSIEQGESRVKKKTVKDIQLTNKRVVMRVDFNVPIDNEKITDDTRIKAALPTINYILNNDARLILMSHLGRPQGLGFEEAYSLKPVAEHLGKILGKSIPMAPDCIGEEVQQLASELNSGEILMLENTRFHAEETGKIKTDGLSEAQIDTTKAQMKRKQQEMAMQLAALGDVFVNDAFGTAHRAHASTSVIAQYTKTAVAGLLMEKELKFLGEAIESPQHPILAIIGGAKISGKLELLRNLMRKVDIILIGGGMAYTFKKAKGQKIGNSIVEDNLLETALETMNEASKLGKKFFLPEDNILADKFDVEANTQIAKGNFPEDWEGVDIGPETIELFSKEIKEAKTILWNGPMGCFEMAPFSKGTYAICKAVADSGAVTIIGGGDSVSAVNSCGLQDKMTHVSTGGGASLEFLEGKELPGVTALNDR